MPCWDATATSGKRSLSIDFVIAGWCAAGVVQSESSGHEGDGDRIDANIDPALVSDTEVEVESEAEQKAPCGHRALTATETRVVECRPGIVDEQPFGPVSHVVSLVDNTGAEGDEADTASDEDGVSKYFEVETFYGRSEGWVGGFKGQEASPRNVVVLGRHAEHVEASKNQSPDAEEDHS